MWPLASHSSSGQRWGCFRHFWNVFLGIGRFGNLPRRCSCPHGIAIVLPLALFVCVSWRLDCWGLLGYCHVVWAALLYGAYKNLGSPLPVISFLLPYFDQDGWCGCVLSVSTVTASFAV